MPLSVIGAGFGRTGTLSLKTALDMTAVGPCYHMKTVIAHPEHRPLWLAAAAGEAIDWDGLFSGFGSAIDWPACYFWRLLADRYPAAKVILTVRDPDRWYDSVHNTIYQSMIRPGPDGKPQAGVSQDIILKRTFDHRFEDRAHALAAFNAHNAAVVAALPAERLLVYRVADGWPPLC
ncbi:MAG: sulfotransferase [Pseudomonadota bacterium]|nr:sulfotransferase [Pseudomonadota bacterium]